MDLAVAKLSRQPALTAATSPRDKIKDLSEIAAIAGRLRKSGQIVVQAHGAFDLLHLGHVRHLEAARKLGDVLDRHHNR